jgi:hypothetical protein
MNLSLVVVGHCQGHKTVGRWYLLKEEDREILSSIELKTFL